MKSYFTITADGTVQNLSAFDVAGPGGPRTQLFDWFNSTQLASIQNTLPMLGAASHNIVVTIASIWNENMGKTLVRVLFTDGSEITLEYESINKIISVVEDSAKDRYGNVIPATSSDIDGTRFDYSREGPNGPAQQRMTNYLRIYGVAVTNGSTRWVCVRVSDGAWRCALY